MKVDSACKGALCFEQRSEPLQSVSLSMWRQSFTNIVKVYRYMCVENDWSVTVFVWQLHNNLSSRFHILFPLRREEHFLNITFSR